MKSRWKVESRWKRKWKRRWKSRWKVDEKVYMKRDIWKGIDEKVYMKRYMWKEGKEEDKELNVRINDSSVFEIKSRHSSRH